MRRRGAVLVLVLGLLPETAGAAVGAAACGPYRARVDTVAAGGQDIFTLERDGVRLLRIDSCLRLNVGLSILGPFDADCSRDIDADGVPDLVVWGWSGGAHCCFETWLLALGDSLRVTEIVGGDSEPEFRQLDDDPALEVVVTDWAFAYWPYSFGGSPAVTVALDWGPQGLRPSAPLTAALQPQTPPGAAEIAALRDDPGWRAGGPPYDRLFNRALGLLYAGRTDDAAAFIAQAWGGSREDLARMLVGMARRLSLSLYYPALAPADR